MSYGFEGATVNQFQKILRKILVTLSTICDVPFLRFLKKGKKKKKIYIYIYIYVYIYNVLTFNEK